jgi:hypothetical protein
MLQAYIKEYPHFKEQVYDEQYKEMFDYIENELMK